MSEKMSLKTNDREKSLHFKCRYEIQDYFTFSLGVRSGPFQGESSFCASRTQLRVFAEEIENLEKKLEGHATLQDSDSDAFVTLEGMKFGRIAVIGQVGGTHQSQYLKFRFETDQTVLSPFQRQINELLSESV